MRRMLAVLAAVVLAVFPAAAAPASSLSGEVAYLAEQGPVQRSGFWGSDPTITDRQVLSIGYTACGFLAQGLTDEQVLREMATYLPPRGSLAYVVGMDGIGDARLLCP